MANELSKELRKLFPPRLANILADVAPDKSLTEWRAQILQMSEAEIARIPGVGAKSVRAIKSVFTAEEVEARKLAAEVARQSRRDDNRRNHAFWTLCGRFAHYFDKLAANLGFDRNGFADFLHEQGEREARQWLAENVPDPRVRAAMFKWVMFPRNQRERDENARQRAQQALQLARQRVERLEATAS